VSENDGKLPTGQPGARKDGMAILSSVPCESPPGSGFGLAVREACQCLPFGGLPLHFSYGGRVSVSVITSPAPARIGRDGEQRRF